jgi:hypothetical protein
MQPRRRRCEIELSRRPVECQSGQRIGGIGTALRIARASRTADSLTDRRARDLQSTQYRFLWAVDRHS